jgi:hypothetical protein
LKGVGGIEQQNLFKLLAAILKIATPALPLSPFIWEFQTVKYEVKRAFSQAKLIIFTHLNCEFEAFRICHHQCFSLVKPESVH